ncbi:MAG: helix-turn-helix domain-containing protein, partial [Ruminiclostridium sp.]|nr:helix-turn-helix domain-containing protein [Ruminiclostridium sp.]
MFEMRFNYFVKGESGRLFAQCGIHESYMFPHIHQDFFELVLVTGGTAENIAGDNRFFIQKGDVLIMPPGSSHSYESARGLHIINIMFLPEVLEARAEAFREAEGFVSLFESGKTSYMRLSPADFACLSELALELESEYNSQKPCRGAVMDACFTRIVAALSRLYGLPVKRREISAVTNAAEYLDEHYMEEFPLKKAMELSNYSRRHFCRLFTEVYDISPQDYLLDVRMRHAADYLRNSGVSIADAAARCGFSDSG